MREESAACAAGIAATDASGGEQRGASHHPSEASSARAPDERHPRAPGVVNTLFTDIGLYLFRG